MAKLPKKSWDQNLPYAEHKLRSKLIAHNAKSIITHYDPDLVIPRKEVAHLLNISPKRLLEDMTHHEWRILQIKEALRYQSEDQATKEIEAKIKAEKERRAKLNEAPKHILKSEVKKETTKKKSRVPHIPKLTNAEILEDLRELGAI